MFSTRVICSLSAIALILCMAGAAVLVDPIDSRRHTHSQEIEASRDHSLPPWVTLSTTALGSFRGVMVDILWYRTRRLQAEGQFFEANQLSQWITTLQPRFPQVWSFQAWNMAYNISVATYTPEERWDWVHKGIVLLRDRGIVYNPSAIKLYRELGWIFFHKIGHYMDDMHWYYKYRLAEIWQELMGAPPAGASTQEVLDRFAAIVAAPDTILRLTHDAPGVGTLLSRLDHLGYQPDETLLRQIGRVRMFEGWVDARLTNNDQAAASREWFDLELAGVLAQPGQADSVEALLAFLRKGILQDRYHMDPAFMLKLMKLYGPLDWRHAAAHGLYWSERGVYLAARPNDSGDPSESKQLEGIDLLNTNRQSLHAIQQLSRFGRVILDPVNRRLDLMPDPRFIPAYDRAMDLAKGRIDRGEFGEVGSKSFDMGHENFLLEAMTHHYTYGNMDQARYFHKKARTLYRGKPQNIASGRYRKPLAELVRDQLSHHLGMKSNTNQFIRAMLARAFDHGLARHRMDVFDRFVELAREAHARYQKDKPREALTTQGRLRLLPFDQIVAQTYVAFIQSSEIPILRRSRVWAYTPLRLKRSVYNRLKPVFKEQARRAGLVSALVFPDPSGAAPAVEHPNPGSQTIPPLEQDPVRIERK